jgi:methionyl-tRNA formyltransferase
MLVVTLPPRGRYADQILTPLLCDDIALRMKVIYMGAPSFAVAPLQALYKLGVELVAVLTKAPKAGGRRGLATTKTAVHEEAERLGLRVLTPLTLRSDDSRRVLLDLQADVAVVAAYGLLLPAEALAAPRLGCFNLHASLLPRWRGAAPVQRAIMAGDIEAGVSIMKMEVGLDTGPIAGELRTAIDPSETAEELTTRLSLLGAQSLSENWDALINQRLKFEAQASTGVEYARKIDKSETPIDWSQSAERVRGHIHGLSPFPGAHTEIEANGGRERLKILRAEVVAGGGQPGVILDEQMTVDCGVGAIRVLRAQRAGRNAVSGLELMRSGFVRVGERLAASG